MPAIFHTTFKDKKHIFEVDDISTLKAKVRSEFQIQDDIRFQLYDKEWDDWVDVEIHQLPQRGKIKIISSPNELTAPAHFEDLISSPSSSLFSESCSFPDDPIIVEPETANFISSVSELAQEKETCQSTSIAEESPSAVATASHSGNLTEDNTDESDGKRRLHVMQQWPDKFVIPRLPILLESKLKAERMPNDRERRQIVQTLFDYMAGFTSYPLSTHYSEAVGCLLEKYPFLGKESIPGARPAEYWRMKLMDKFRNERKHMPADKRRKSSHSGMLPNAQVKDTDDAVSIEKFKKWMQEEAQKCKQNNSKVSQMMEMTFKSRRQWILEGRLTIAELKDEYPCLFSQSQILLEMSRITPSFDASQPEALFLINLEAYAAYLIDSCQSKKSAKTIVNKYEEAIATLSNDQAKEAKVLTALVLVPFYFKGEKLSAYLVGDEEEEPVLTAHPKICFKGDIYTTKEIVVQAENVLICACTSMLSALCALICTYFTFDIEYPKACKNSLMLVETMLGAQKRTTRSVQSLIQKVLSRNAKT